MKVKLVFVYTVFCTILCISSSAQIRAVHLSLKDSTKPMLYIGIDNKIIFRNIPEGAKVKYDGDFVEPELNNNNEKIYTFYPTLSGKDKIYVLKDKNVLYQQEYTIDYIPEPSPKLGMLKDTTSGAVLSRILQYPCLLVIYPGYAKLAATVTSYKITVMHSGSAFSKVVSGKNVNGQNFDAEVMEKIKSCVKGDYIEITDIKAQLPGGTQKALSKIKVNIL